MIEPHESEESCAGDSSPPRDDREHPRSTAFWAQVREGSIHLRDLGDPHDSPVVWPPYPLGQGREVPGAIGRYRVIGEIARGGIGAVLKVRDMELGRDVALKRLLEEHRENPIMVQRLVEEAQIGGQLQHPGTVPVHELCFDGDGRPYFTMKLVKGRTLAALLSERRDPSENLHRFLGIFEQVCQTIAYAHAHRVIHRDLKSANVMVGAFGEVQVMDWGLAKVRKKAEEGTAATPQLSAIETVRTGSSGSDSLSGSILGTPSHMSPEQARGELAAVDERSDVFSLGAILCEILTGSAPYGGSSAEDTYHRAKKGYLEDGFKRLDACGADQALISLAKRCLAFESRDRPQDAGGVAREVTDHLASLEGRVRVTVLEAARAHERAVQTRRIRRLTVCLATALLLAMLVAGVVYIWTYRAGREKMALAARSINEDLNIAREIRSQVAGSSKPEVSRLSIAARSALRAENRAREEGHTALLSDAADLRRGLDEALQRAQEQEERDETNRKTVERLAEIQTTLDEDPSRGGFAYARLFRDLGVEIEKMTVDDAALRIRQTGIAIELARALESWAAVWKDFHGRGAEVWKRLLAIARKADPDPWRSRLRLATEQEDPVELRKLAADIKVDKASPDTLLSLASSLREIEAYNLATALHEQARQLYPSEVRVHSEYWGLRATISALALRPDSSSAFRNVAAALWRRDQSDRALGYAREAVRCNPGSQNAWNILGILLHDQGDDAGAREASEKALSLDPHSSVIYNNLGVHLRRLAPLEERIRLFRKAIDIDPQDGVSWANLAVLLKARREWHGAVAALREAIRLGSARQDSGDLNGEIGWILWRELGDPQKAVPFFREWARISRESPQPRIFLSRILYELQLHPDAIAALGGALELDLQSSAALDQVLYMLQRTYDAGRSDEFRIAVEGLLGSVERGRVAASETTTAWSRIYLAALDLLAATGRGDVALELARKEIQGTGRTDARSIGILARILERIGQRREAILLLEEALRLPGSHNLLEAQIAVYRKSSLPDLPTYGSIDAAFEEQPIVARGAEWRFFEGRRAPSHGLEWTRLDFDDGRWLAGPSGFGYGMSGNETVLHEMRGAFTSLYIRRKFDVPSPQDYSTILLRITFEDGVVAYLNGEEIYRQHAGASGIPLPAAAEAAASLPFAETQEVDITKKVKAGLNILAIQGLNSSLESADFTLMATVQGTFAMSPEAKRRRLEEFQRSADGENAGARCAYFEGRALQRQKNLSQAVERFRLAGNLDPRGPEPHLRLAECLRALGRAPEAEGGLRDLMAKCGEVREDVLHLWLAIAAEDLKLGWTDIDSLLPGNVLFPDRGEAGQLIHAIRMLEEAGGLRIKCGGEAYVEMDGRRWLGDRFFSFGTAYSPTRGIDVVKTADPTLYRSHRYFGIDDRGVARSAPPYRIPLPKGFYRLALHFAEVYLRSAGARRFDVLLDGVSVLANYEPCEAAGFGAADVKTFIVSVKGRYLDIDFRNLAENALVAAIELERLDLQNAVELLRREIEKPEGRTSRNLSLLADALFQQGQAGEALFHGEAASRLSGFSAEHAQLLRRIRVALLPDLASFASVDAALAGELAPPPEDPRPAPEGGEGDVLSAFMQAGGSEDSSARFAYAEARVLQRQGRHRQAIEKFEEVLKSGTKDPEPHLHLAQCLRAAGNPGAAEDRLRSAASSGVPLTAGLEQLWLELWIRDLGKSPWDALTALPTGALPEDLPIAPTSEHVGQSWRFTTVEPSRGWQDPAFDDAAWDEGPGGFGVGFPHGACHRTIWSTPAIWLRRKFKIPQRRLIAPHLRIYHDDDARVYIDGRQLLFLPAYTTEYVDIPIQDPSVLQGAEATLAVQCLALAGPQFIDVGIHEKIGAARRVAELLQTRGAYRINCGGAEHQSAGGTTWEADSLFIVGRSGSYSVNPSTEIRKTDDDALYRSMRRFERVRTGDAGYCIPVPPSSYQVVLHFAEIESGIQETGMRSFGVRLEGRDVLQSYDPIKEAGLATADARRFSLVVQDDWLNIDFVQEERLPIVSAIEILKAE